MADIVVSVKIPSAAVPDCVEALRTEWEQSLDREEDDVRPADKALFVTAISQMMKGKVAGLRRSRQTVNVDDIEITEDVP